MEEEDPQQGFDSEDFLEMILAYLPQLEGIDVSCLSLRLRNSAILLISGYQSH